MKDLILRITGAKIITLSKIFVSKKKFFLAFIFIFSQFYAYPQFHTVFDSVDLPQCWIGDREKFIVDEIYGLKLYDDDLSTKSAQVVEYSAMLSTPYNIFDNNKWEFNVLLNFNPSAYNYVKIFIYTGNVPDPESDESLYILMGGSKDEVSLYHNKSGVKTKICGKEGVLNQNYSFISIGIYKEKNDNWVLAYNVNDGDFAGQDNGSMTMQMTESSFISMFCNYTKTNNGKFYFGSVLSEKIDSEDSGNDGKDDAGGGDKDSQGGDGGDGENENNDKTEHYIPSEDGDIIISEIMANPKGAPALPEVEYIEIYNRLDTDISLNRSAFYYDNKKYTLPDSIVKANSYKVICKTQYTALMPDQENIIPLAGFPILANTGKEIGLISQYGDTLHSVSYNESLYKDKTKKSGGWSLEMKDTERYNDGDDNWAASKDPSGGTPGFINSYSSDISDYENILVADSLRTGLWLINKQLSLQSNQTYYDLIFGYRFAEEGYKANIRMYSKNGRMIWEILHDKILEGEGVYNAGKADCISENEAPGIYIIFTEVISPYGKLEKKKEILVIIP